MTLKTGEAFNHSDATYAGSRHQGKITGVVFWVSVITQLSIITPLHSG